VVKCTVFLVDIKDYPKMNEVYATSFPKDPPARSTVAGAGSRSARVWRSSVWPPWPDLAAP